MKKTANVMIRKTGALRTIPITSDDKPEIIEAISTKWQRIINLSARLLGIPSGLIMRITEETMEVFLKSENSDNPYLEQSAEQLGNGLYCETVIGTNNELLVPNALEDPIWADNPDVKLNMISYFGLPIQWPDQQMFGTICVLDSKANPYNETFKELLMEFKFAIETDLELLISRNHLEILAQQDPLTSILNRRKISEILTLECDRSVRYKTPLSIAMIDLDNFKQVNDQFGHDVGDKLLKTFTSSVSTRIRSIDIFGRWGGDEFLLICPNTDSAGITSLLGDIRNSIKSEMRKTAEDAGFSYGIAELDNNDNGPDDFFKRADIALYEIKKRR
jgi:diguanylate cyclase (GGDEF)-like protein